MNGETSRFLKNGLVFAVIVVLLLSAANYFYEEKILPRHVLERKEANYRQYLAGLEDRKIDYAFFGDSHTVSEFDPDYVNGSFNFGIGGENYIKTYYRLRQLLYEDKIKIGHAVLEIDLHTFSTITTDETRRLYELWHYGKFIPYPDMSGITGKSLPDVWVRTNFPVIGARENMFYRGTLTPVFLAPDEGPFFEKGWYCANLSLEGRGNGKGEALETVERHFGGQNRTSGINLEYFEKTLELAKENKIKIIFIKYPLSRYYDDAAAAMNVTKDDYYATIFGVAEKTGVDYEVLDYYALFFNETRYFADPDHLNCAGADAFSKIVARDLRELGD